MQPCSTYNLNEGAAKKFPMLSQQQCMFNSKHEWDKSGGAAAALYR
jgi:hypothetical protein